MADYITQKERCSLKERKDYISKILLALPEMGLDPLKEGAFTSIDIVEEVNPQYLTKTFYNKETGMFSGYTYVPGIQDRLDLLWENGNIKCPYKLNALSPPYCPKFILTVMLNFDADGTYGSLYGVKEEKVQASGEVTYDLGDR